MSATQPRSPGSIPLFMGASLTFLLLILLPLPTAKRWLSSGCAFETLLIIYGYGIVVPWPLLATLNLIYAIASTSWLLFYIFTAACYPIIFVTCLWLFTPVANAVRRILRRWLRQVHWTRDKIGLFNLPALEIDTDVAGLLVVRGITVCLSSLTIIAHGIELGIRLSDDIELAIAVDEVTIQLFRGIAIGEVFCNLKDDELKMMFAKQGLQSEGDGVRAVLVSHTEILKAAVTKSAEYADRRQLKERLTHVSYMKDVPASSFMENVEALELDDENADKRYNSALEEIQRTSAVGQSRLKVKYDAQADGGPDLADGDDARMAVVVGLQDLPSVPHPPKISIRVTTLQTMAPPWVRRLLHRLPLLLRVILLPISYLHPIETSYVVASGPGAWILALLSQNVFKHYSDLSSEVQRLENKIAAWLTDQSFSVQFRRLDATALVPVSTAREISVQIKVADVSVHRTAIADAANTSEVALRLTGADGLINLPAFLLPHHEHIIPAPPSGIEAGSVSSNDESSDKKSDDVKDEAEITFSAHASLPARLDQSLLGFIAAIVKASKVIELEKAFNGEDQQESGVDEPASPTSPVTPEDDSAISSPESPKKDRKVKTFARSIKRNLKEGTAGQSIKEFAKDLNQSTRDSMKKAVVIGVVNDEWIAKLISKIALNLESGRGSFGYSGGIPVPLQGYRETEDGSLSKLLP